MSTRHVFFTERDGIRYAPLYMGGPKGVRKTPYTLAVECASGITHLKDRDGVSFAGSDTGTRALRSLRGSMCEAKVKGAGKKAAK